MQDPHRIIVDLLSAIGEDPSREGLRDTPKRVVKSWQQIHAGYEMDPAEILSRSFSETCNYNQMVLLRNIDFFSTCEHHLLPFYGRAHVAYIPGDIVVGISKLARLVDCYARRLQIQERMTEQIANDIDRYLRPKGVAVLVSAQHLCITSRGIQKSNAEMVTSALRGAFLENSTRAEFLRLINGGIA